MKIIDKQGENKIMAFVPGKSGNPNGRPKKGKTMTDLLEKYLDMSVEVKKDGVIVSTIKRKELFIEHLYELAMDSDTSLAAIKYIWDRIEGTPTQKSELTGVDGEGLEFVVNIKNAGEGEK